MLYLFLVIDVSHQSELPTTSTDELPKPHVVIFGKSGNGKAQLANVLLGHPPKCDRCAFEVCTRNLESCTNGTTFRSGYWLGKPEVYINKS